MTRIKICGLTSEGDARHAAACGAQFVGLVLAESSRRADVSEAARWLPAIRREFPAVRVVGVFVRPSAAEVTEAVDRLGLDLVQVHGVEYVAPGAAQRVAPCTAEHAEEDAWGFASPRPLILAAGPESLARAAAARPWAILADCVGPKGAGGTGTPLDWAALAASLPDGLGRAEEPRLFLAGGLDAGNVAEAIRVVVPWAVDASSRLEITPGRKDPAKVAAFCEAVRVADRGAPRRDS
jgi:phosphoribosylanthranilate isomerase